MLRIPKKSHWFFLVECSGCCSRVWTTELNLTKDYLSRFDFHPKFNADIIFRNCFAKDI